MLNRLTAKHLREPSGLIGRYFGSAMNRFNRAMNETAVQILDLQPHERVLDIGFGGGLSLKLLDEHVEHGQVHGVEISTTMLRRARRAFAGPIQAGRIVLARAGVDELPFPDAHFDAVCTVNTIYFWPDVTKGLREIARVLRGHGPLVLCYRPRQVMEKLKFTHFAFEMIDSDEVEAALSANGFVVRRHTLAHDGHLGYACALACKKGD